jgi:hypothetical protein
MNDHTRRGFLGMIGVGAAAVSAAAIPADAETRPTLPDNVAGPLVAYVRDARAGEVAVLAGEREVVVHDRDLAARIANVVR